ncbi:MAG: hypothetical protein JF571_10490 [Asticcacaulis sp.]|nr:hypothetical protein [Asticcacaulis sp.]
MLVAYFAAAAAAAYAPPLDPAASGQIQCYVPDTARKTCSSMAYYVARDDGSFDNRAVVLINKAPAVTLETTTRVGIKNGAVCGALRAEDIAAGKVSVSGRVMTPEEASPVLNSITQALGGVIGHEICTAFVPDASGKLTAQASMDGTRQAEQDQPVLWVAPSDGYTVAP